MNGTTCQSEAMTDNFQKLHGKTRSLLKYREIFSTWWIAALARYCGGFLGRERLIRLRDGRCFFMRPASDQIAMGELFIAETYRACCADKGVKLVWDVGGNIGLFVIWAAPFFKDARFESFEPCAPTFDLLKRNQAGNPTISWRVHQYGLSSRNEICEGYVPRGMYGSVSRYLTNGALVSLPMKNVTEVWTAAGAPVIDLIKIDCEGGEYDIIEAMSDAMLKSIRTILMELHSVKGKDPASLVKRLESCGFSLNQAPSYSAILVARKP